MFSLLLNIIFVVIRSLSISPCYITPSLYVRYRTSCSKIRRNLSSRGNTEAVLKTGSATKAVNSIPVTLSQLTAIKIHLVYILCVFIALKPVNQVLLALISHFQHLVGKFQIIHQFYNYQLF